MTSYCDAFPIAGTSHSSYVPGVWTKKADIDQIILSGAIEVNARRKSPPNFSLPMLPPPIYSTYRDQQGALQSLDASPFSSETLAVPPPYSPRGYMMEMHSVVSSNEEPQRWDACSSSTVFHKSFKLHSVCLVFLTIMDTSLLPIFAGGSPCSTFTFAPYT